MKAVEDIQLHGFGDASKVGCCLTVYVVASDGVKTTQGLLTSKVRVAKKNLTIPRLELVSGHMGANMLDNTRMFSRGILSLHVTDGWIALLLCTGFKMIDDTSSLWPTEYEKSEGRRTSAGGMCQQIGIHQIREAEVWMQTSLRIFGPMDQNG